MSHIVVLGAGQAGASLAIKLRALGFEGEITMIGAEPVAPYQRPPLSKAYLMGEMPLERLYLRPPAFYAEAGITLRLDAPVTGIDPVRKTLRLADGEIAYDQLALTTGSVPRRLPEAIGGALAGVHVVRDLADVDALAPEAVAGARVLVVGGGYIGLEAAAVCAKRGMSVTLIEMGARILQRVACPETSAYFRALHGAHGVTIREGIGLERLTGAERVTGALLSDGSEIAVDLVIAGIGVSPASDLAEAAGLKVEDGIVVDALGQSSDPSIWAAGDCARFPYRGAMIRLESVQNAIDQAEAVAANMMGAGADYVPQPWFWSDQYDVKLQIAGLNLGYDRVVVRGGGAALSHWYYADGTLLAVDAMNDPRAFMVAKRLLAAGLSPAPELVADPSVELKALLGA